MRVLFSPNKIEILLHDQEIELLAKTVAHRTTDSISVKDFSANDGRTLLIRRDNYQPKIEDKFKLKDNERKAAWMLLKENYKINEEMKRDAATPPKPTQNVK